MPIRLEPDLDKMAAAWSAFTESLGSALESAADATGRLRYGVPTSEKERLATSGTLPGAPVDNTADQDVANRYAAGYLFGQQYPNAAPVIQPIVDRIKTSDLPLFGGETPETQSWATAGVNAGSGTLGDIMRGRR